MKRLQLAGFSLLFLFAGSVNASNSLLKMSFLDACSASPYVEEMSDCGCVFNEVVNQYGNKDTQNLISYIRGEEKRERKISDSVLFISGKCEG